MVFCKNSLSYETVETTKFMGNAGYMLVIIKTVVLGHVGKTCTPQTNSQWCGQDRNLWNKQEPDRSLAQTYRRHM